MKGLQYPTSKTVSVLNGLKKAYFLFDREDNPEGENDACRVHGSLEVNKVAGNFHITAGK